MYLRPTEQDKVKECSNVYYQCLSHSLSILQIKKIISYKIVSPKLLQTLYRELTNYREFSNSPYEGVTLITTAIL